MTSTSEVEDLFFSSSMSASIAAADAVTAMIDAGAALLYERYLISRESSFIEARTLPDLAGLAAWATPVVDAEPSAEGWDPEPEPLLAPPDAWARAALLRHGVYEPRRELVARERTIGEVNVLARLADTAARQEAASEARSIARALSASARRRALRLLASPQSTVGVTDSPHSTYTRSHASASQSHRRCEGEAKCSPATLERGQPGGGGGVPTAAAQSAFPLPDRRTRKAERCI